MKRVLTQLAMLLLSICSAAAAAPPDAQQMLAACDAIRNPARPFRLKTALLDYRDSKQVGSNGLEVFSKLEADSGQYANLIRFVSPARDLNKLMLKAGRDLWLYDPNNKASIRTSPQQRLLGQVSNGDVVTTNLSREYHAVLVGDENIQDGEHQTCQCHKLNLTASVPEATYSRIELWLNAANAPIKAYFYAESGRLLKTAFYRHYQEELGVSRPTEIVIIDGLMPTWITVMRFSDYAWYDVPDSWLRPEYFSSVKVE
ncbi:outer membrane lipoprotein-sorting protein [Paraburkholderia terricola]|uniref:Uncharacterized protein TP-0789 domain-containing protein n=1 Tax=Paraburkholderia terricola TaxID=169427 RepID=A0ABU1M1D6_9BURK|nr:outer membrane lipoprotein-sorting protein [Paraburkholderia terricola]MDR6412827.1 hypothetical protein [Paraburkholderia terricola]MDR6450035.1 hypothetical protein [Paraburkholderia terricola]MDR6484901.1 hypothetical protein [Paraburkholderia terricola]